MLTLIADDVIQGPSDGRGGFLPALKPMSSTSQVGPAVPVPRGSMDGQSPPPLRRQTSSSVGPAPLSPRGSVMNMYQRGSVSQGIPPSSPRRGSLMSTDSRAGITNPAPASSRAYRQMPVFLSTSSIQQQQQPPPAAQLDTGATPRKKPSVIQEADEDEERAASRASIPGEIEQEQSWFVTAKKWGSNRKHCVHCDKLKACCSNLHYIFTRGRFIAIELLFSINWTDQWADSLMLFRFCVLIIDHAKWRCFGLCNVKLKISHSRSSIRARLLMANHKTADRNILLSLRVEWR